jgi:hypothetical protein
VNLFTEKAIIKSQCLPRPPLAGFFLQKEQFLLNLFSLETNIGLKFSFLVGKKPVQTGVAISSLLVFAGLIKSYFF